MTDTSKEAISEWAGAVRAEECSDGWPVEHGLADFIKVLAAERDAATERAEKAEAEVAIHKRAWEGAKIVAGSLKESVDILWSRVAALEGALHVAEVELEARGYDEDSPVRCAIQAALSASPAPAVSNKEGE